MLSRRCCTASSRRGAPWTCCARCLFKLAGHVIPRVLKYVLEEALYCTLMPCRSMDVLHELPVRPTVSFCT